MKMYEITIQQDYVTVANVGIFDEEHYKGVWESLRKNINKANIGREPEEMYEITVSEMTVNKIYDVINEEGKFDSINK